MHPGSVRPGPHTGRWHSSYRRYFRRSSRHNIRLPEDRGKVSLIAATVQIIGIDNGVGTGDAQFDFGTGAGIMAQT